MVRLIVIFSENTKLSNVFLVDYSVVKMAQAIMDAPEFASYARIFAPTKEKLEEFFSSSETTGLRVTKLADGRVRERLPLSEIKKRRAKYRQEYRQRPAVKLAIQKKNSDPEVVKKRKEYARRPTVQRRKRHLAKRRRLALRFLEKENPELLLKFITLADRSLSSADGSDGSDNEMQEEET